MENCGTDARRLDVFYHLYAPRPSWRHQNQYTVTLKEQVSLPGLYKEVLNCKSGLLPSRWRRQNLLPKTWTIWCASWVFSAFSQCSDCNTLHGRKHLFCLLYGGLTVWLILPPMLSVRFMVDMKIEQCQKLVQSVCHLVVEFVLEKATACAMPLHFSRTKKVLAYSSNDWSWFCFDLSNFFAVLVLNWIGLTVALLGVYVRVHSLFG